MSDPTPSPAPDLLAGASAAPEAELLVSAPVQADAGVGTGDVPVADEPKAAPRLRTADRFQFVLGYGCPDELVGPDHKVRILWQVIDRQDWSAFSEPIKAREGNAGRDATDPRILAAVWLYATMRNIGSAREVDRLCKESDPFKWILGGVTVNYHMLSAFRVGHGDALDELFTRILAILVDKGLVKAKRITQDGIRVRAAAGADSFRSEERLDILLEESRQVVTELRQQVEDPARSAKVSARKKAARVRAAADKQRRLEEAVAQLPKLKEKQQETAKRAGNGKRGTAILEKTTRVSTTDAEARVMKMPNGGFNPAVNVQLATDTASRAIVGVEVTNEGSDSAGLAEPMRQQVEERTGQKVQEHGLDGGYVKTEDLERAHAQGVALFIPPKPARNVDNRGAELEPKPGDSEAVMAWKKRMASAEGKTVYKLRASTSETVNADLRQHRALKQFAVRGLKKVRCVTMWCALAYNLTIFAKVLSG